MAFEIFQYPEADEDILEAINYYKKISNSVASNFEKQLSKASGASAEITLPKVCNYSKSRGLFVKPLRRSMLINFWQLGMVLSEDLRIDYLSFYL